MNEFELDIIMGIFDLNKKYSREYNKFYYEFCDCKYYYEYPGHTVIWGRTPYELAQLIREKYDSEKFGIRLPGHRVDCVIHNHIYIHNIYTIEGLVAFLIETKNYYSETQDNFCEFEKILDMTYKKILENINPQISVRDWMLDSDNKKECFERIFLSNTYLDFKIRTQIELFDSVVNPFANNRFDINDSKFIVGGYNDFDRVSNWFKLIDKESGIAFFTLREKSGFVVRLHIPLEYLHEIQVYHIFDKNGEEFVVQESDEYGMTRIDYNLRDENFGEHYGEKHKATTKDKYFVIDTLDKCITLARNIVAKNICVKTNDIETVLKKIRKPEAK